MRLVYACRFEIVDDSAFEQTQDAYQSWINQHYAIKRGLDGFSYSIRDNKIEGVLLSGHNLVAKTYKTCIGEACVLEWSYPDSENDTMKWRNIVRLGKVDGVALVEHSIFIQSTDYQISPARVLLWSPSVVRKLCGIQSVRIGEISIQAKPYNMSEADVDVFFDILQSSLRRVPVVFLSPYANGSLNLIDGCSLSENLAGVAIVVTVDDPGAVWKMVSKLGRQASCFDGGARIYWPGFSVHDNPRRHPLYIGREVQSLGQEQSARSIERMIFSVASFRFVPDSRISDIIKECEDSARLREMELRKGDDGFWEQYCKELLEKFQKTEEKLEYIKSENENLKQNQQFLFSSYVSEVVADAPSQSFTPRSVYDAVAYAKKFCCDMEFLDSALDAAKDSPFQRPDEILDALHDLNDISKLSNDGAVDIQDELSKRGWGKRCSMKISKTTRNKFSSDYSFNYGSAAILFEPHITFGSGGANSCASIHFILDEETRKIVVGYVGRHLPNTNT